MKRRTLDKRVKARRRKKVSGRAIPKAQNVALLRGLKPESRLQLLREIEPFIQKTAKATTRLKGHEFVNCLRGSLSKSFEFCLEAHQGRTNRIAFFLVPSLRSICEDLVVLSYLGKMSSADRNGFVSLLIQHEMVAKLDAQSKFFKLARPEQPVIQPGTIDKKKIEDSIRQIWKRNGWTGLTSSWMPTVRQIAEKNHIDVLTTLYDYIYRLTSGAVHFNPGLLLRTGWGKPIPRFSPKNFSKYYVAYARTYGLFLFCCYFELFGRFLRPDKSVSALVTELRLALLSEFRWPEMITFEELNFRPPQGDVLRYVYRYVDALQRRRQTLKTPDRATTQRHVKCLLDNFQRYPEDAKRLEHLVDRLRRGGEHAK
jgi:hypothetical protein